MGVRVFAGSCYLGILIGDQDPEKEWLAEKVKVWKDSVEVLSRVKL